MVPLKVAYEDDIRKIYVESLTIATLSENIKTLFPDLQSVPFEDLFVYYIDDEKDKIRIKMDLELTEALRYTQECNSTLKIIVQRLDTPSTITTDPSDPNVGIRELAPFLGMLHTMLLNNPEAMQQMAAILPNMLPVLNSILAQAQNTPPADTTSFHAPFSPIISSSDCGSSATTSCASVSTNTLVDARDAATETFLYGVTQTTQTQQPYSNTIPTQTNLNATSSTQTAHGAIATQTTQTHQNATSATQTAQGALASHTTQTQAAQTTCETQTPTGEPAPVDFYESLAGTQFGGLLAQLRELGFNDREKCVQALVKYGGKLPEAIDELLLDQLLD